MLSIVPIFYLMILQQNSLPPYFTDHDECEQLGDRQQSMNHGIGGHFCTQANSICVNTLGSYKCKLHGKKSFVKKRQTFLLVFLR